jgi:hypothetical protein
MTHATHRLPILASMFVAIALATVACGPGGASPTPSAVASPSVAPTATPSTAPAVSPSPLASAASACVVKPQTVAPSSDRVVDLKVTPGAASDALTFVFGNASLPGPAGPPEGALDVAQPPYTQAGSGATIQVTGQHVLIVRFTGMSLQNDAGEETYAGPAEVKPALPALRHAVLYDATEGVIGWYVGYDGTGCPTLARQGNDVTLTLAHE